MLSRQFVYTGPSWAFRSYDPPGTIENSNPTNLAKEWQISCVDLSLPGSTVLDRIEAVNKSDIDLPIVWIYNEPVQHIKVATGMDFKEFVQRSDWLDLWKECNQWCLNKINSIGRPVLIIGAHSDIVECNFPNITIGYPSWQRWIAFLAGLTVDNDIIHVKMDDGGNYSLNMCWGAEVIHRFIHEHRDINPSQEIINSVWDMYFFWKELEKANLFFEVHPNKEANQQFAKFLFPVVNKFLQDTQ